MMEQKRPLPLLPLIGVSVILLGGAGAAYWFFSNRIPVSVGNLPIGSEVLPQNVLLTVSISTEPKLWEQLQTYGTSETQSLLKDGLTQIQSRLTKDTGYNYEADIKPWIGREATIALLPMTTAAPAASPSPKAPLPLPAVSQQSTIVVLPIANLAAAKSLLDQPKTPAGRQWSERDYQGIKIRELQGAPQTLSITVLGNRLVVITTNPKAAEKVIDSFKGQPALGSLPGYTTTLQKIPTSQPFGRWFMNLPVAAQLAAENGVQPAEANALEQFRQHQGLTGTIDLKPNGIHFTTISWLKPDSPNKHVVDNNGKTMPSRLPANTLMMVSGGNLQRLWQQYSRSPANLPDSPVSPNRLRTGLRSTTGLDLDKDILAWAQGEFAMALTAAPQGSQSPFPVSLVLMAQATDRTAADKALAQLDQVMGSRYNFKISEAKIADQPVVNWSIPLGGTPVTRGWLEGNVAFFAIGAPIVPDLLPRPKSTLAASEVFQRAVPQVKAPNNGHFFLDFERTLKANLPLFNPSTRDARILAALQTIGVTVAVLDERSIRYDLFVGLATAPIQGNAPPAKP